MKILQIFGWVIVVHLAAFLVIFASPGCQSGPRNTPTPDATVPTASAALTGPYNAGAPAVDLGTPVVTYAPASPMGHAAPTRPGSPAAVAVTPVTPAEDIAPVSTYTVGKGDNLWNLAKKNNLTVAELAKANNISTGTVLQPGKKLIIPGKIGAAAPAKDLATSMPTVKPGTMERTAAANGGEAVKHTVQTGESLGVIARKYQVTVGELAAQNNITDPSKVRAGQQLVIPGFKAVAPKSSTPTVKPVAARPAAETPVQPAPAPRFELTAPPPGQDLDSGLKDTGTEVPTIKVEEAKTEQPETK